MRTDCSQWDVKQASISKTTYHVCPVGC